MKQTERVVGKGGKRRKAVHIDAFSNIYNHEPAQLDSSRATPGARGNHSTQSYPSKGWESLDCLPTQLGDRLRVAPRVLKQVAKGRKIKSLSQEMWLPTGGSPANIPRSEKWGNVVWQGLGQPQGVEKETENMCPLGAEISFAVVFPNAVIF